MSMHRRDDANAGSGPAGERFRFLSQIVFDVRHAWRISLRNPGFTLLAVAILALGIGANTAVFSLASSVLLRPLPFVEPDRLVVLWEDFTDLGGSPRVELAPATFVEWERRARSFEDMAMFWVDAENLIGDGEPERVTRVRTDYNLFSLLGLQPIVGRTFTAEDQGADATPVAIITTGLWQRRFGADPNVLGRTINLGGLNRTVIGVVPPEFQFPNSGAEIYTPGQFTSAELAERTAYIINAVARLAPSVTIGQAQAEMTAIARAIAEERGADGVVGATVDPLHEQLTRTARPTLYVLLAAAAVVLLITCVNVANLLLARGTLRAREIALRQALGSDRSRVVQQLLTESALLAIVGALAGMCLSQLTFGYFARLIPSTLPAGTGPGLDLAVLGFSVALALLTVLLFGTGPALVAARREFNGTLRQSAGQTRSSRGGLRSGLVVVEIMLTVLLLSSAGLLLRSYTQVLAVDPGFEADNVLLLETPLAQTSYGSLSARTSFYERVLDRARRIPGVIDAAYVNIPPLGFGGGRIVITIDGRPAPPAEEFARYITSNRIVSDDYLSALGVPLIDGRNIDSRDADGAPRVVVINKTMADLHWPGEDPLGARLRFGNAETDSSWHTVVGVVGDMRQVGLDEPTYPEMYFSYRQPSHTSPFFWPQNLILRTQGDPMSLAASVRRAVWDVDPDQPVENLRTMKDVLDVELSSRDTQLTLVGTFAGLALLLATVGLYGVLAHNVAWKTSEIGLRMALGAERRQVIGAVLLNALSLAGVGLALGLVCAFGLTGLLSSFLFEVSPADPLTYLLVIVALIGTTLLASYVPARRAASIDPMVALRQE